MEALFGGEFFCSGCNHWFDKTLGNDEQEVRSLSHYRAVMNAALVEKKKSSALIASSLSTVTRRLDPYAGTAASQELYRASAFA